MVWARPAPFGMDDVRLIEELAANAWPADVIQVVDGWRLRCSPGVVARRSNSVLSIAGPGTAGLEGYLELAERFYRARGIEPRFQISPASVPEGLDEALASRGYEIEARADIQAAPIEDVLAGVAARPPFDVQVERRAGREWLALSTELVGRGDPDAMRAGVFDRIAPPAGYVLLRDTREGGARGEPVALGLGVVERGWLGIFSMATAERARRRRAATAVLGALVRWAARLGATSCYLQVEVGNEPARSLYAGLGFATRYGYHYRTLRG